MQRIVSKFRGPWYRLWRPSVLADLELDALEGADLSGRQLSGARLRGAVLNRVNFEAADLSHADLWGAKLRSANLFGASLTKDQLHVAILNEDTVLPSGMETTAAAPAPPIEAVRTLRGHQHPLSSVDVSSDGLLLISADCSGEVLVWDVRQLRKVQRFVLGSVANGVAISPQRDVALIVGAHKPRGG